MNNTKQTGAANVAITLLRCAVGWHFLYEGVSKLMIDNWSSRPYLMGTTGRFSDFYHLLASSEWLGLIDLLNVWGLILIGLALFAGLFVQVASLSGAVLLALYYFAYPPFGPAVLSQADGHLFVVDKIFIEAAILLFLFFAERRGFGVDNIIRYIGLMRGRKPLPAPQSEKEKVEARREVLKNLATLPLMGVMGWGASTTLRESGIDALSGASVQIGAVDISELKGELPKGKLGNLTMSRLIIGGNLIGGWAHARDLLYASSLFKAYNTDKKVFETLMLAEAAGIDTINIGFPHNALMAKYKKETGSKIQVISQIAPRGLKRSELPLGKTSPDLFGDIDEAIGYGADVIQLQGNWCDWLVKDRRYDVIEKMLGYIRSQGYIAGMGAHSVESFIGCEEQGIIPDYYMKTMHHDNYWSAHPVEKREVFEVDGKRNPEHDRWHDNIFCLFPERTVAFVNRTKVPVMGFKVLAAGAIAPEDGFKWAYENGADFICVGMFDFQVVKDVNIATEILAGELRRQRPWMA